MLAIIHAELVMPDHIIPDGYLLLADGLIKEFGEMNKVGDLEGYEIIDAQGAYAAPGLIDIHAHAGGGNRYGVNTPAAAQYMLQHGSTTVLPTLAYALTKEQYLERMEEIKETMKKPEGANIGGIYMEGPYLNPNFGANRTNLPYSGPARPEDYRELIDSVADIVRAWSIAPERENIMEFIKDVKAANPNIKFTVAHSEATPQQVEALIPYGLCIGTHHTNATGTLNKYPECRGVCVDEAVNYNREIYAELICDRRGIHVDPYMLRLIRKIKGDDRIILITDASLNFGPIPGPQYEGATDIWFDNEGEIAGTKLTLNAACRNMMVHTGASIVDVFNYASRNPAKALGFTDRGEIREGLRADIIIVDDKIQVKKVILKGEVVC